MSRDIIRDIEGNEYKTVKIGDQLWMAENLRVGHFRNGEPLYESKLTEEWIRAGEKKTPTWCYNNNDALRGREYGKLYNWHAVNDPRELAPEGWHVPTDDEYTQLINFLGGEKLATKKLKSNVGWEENGNGNNQSGFSGLPGGIRIGVNGNFLPIGYFGVWWSSTEFILCLDTWSPIINGVYDIVYDQNYFRMFGYSVRCIKD